MLRDGGENDYGVQFALFAVDQLTPVVIVTVFGNAKGSGSLVIDDGVAAEAAGRQGPAVIHDAG
jgi:hypothetical protein